MPELGKYAEEVISAYGVSLFLLIALIVMSLHKGRRARADLERIEREVKRSG